MIATVMLDGLTPAARQLNDRLERMGRRLDEIGSIDFTDGSATADEGALREVFVETLGPEEGEAWAREFTAMSRDGYAVLHKPGRGEQGVAFPWRMLNWPLLPQALSPMLLAELGIGPGMPGAARASLLDRFDNVPAEVTDPQNLERLGQIGLVNMLDPVAETNKPDLRDLDDALQVKVKPHTDSPKVSTGVGGVDTVVQALVCVSETEIIVHWWGVELCWDHDCADAIGKALAGGGSLVLAPAFKAFFTAVGAGISSASLAAGVKAAALAVGGPVVLALLVIGVYTGLSILANNTSRGCCLQSPWPVTGGFVWWAAGR
jgi:hypothetical protein